MEMRGNQDIDLGQDTTPPILPFSFSLYDSFLSSRCSSCFSPLTPSLPHIHRRVPLYCSPSCTSSHSPIVSSSAESLLPHSLPPTFRDSSDIRTALRLLQSIPSTCPNINRINGLLTNHHELTSSPEFAAKIRQGAIAMAAARKLHNGGNEEQNDEPLLLEEAVLSLVITNAVEVQEDSGRSLGIAVYEPSFSWINHSCSPNACYRFSISPPNATSSEEDSSSTLKIVPSVSGEECDILSRVQQAKGNKGYEYGPKIIVRSIKKIKNGEEVCVSYTDLLQPKAMRQSELWSKYQFTCSCSRCSASPSNYVDHALEEISASNLMLSSPSFNLKLYRDEATKKLADYVDETISEFLSVGDPESCCEKLVRLLNLGLHGEQLESKDEKSQLTLRLHPFHYIALNAYTILTSAYRIRSSDLLALHSEIDEYQLKAFDMSRTSAAYALLLAGATHHLFRSESSLIASAANYWINAGESLLILARSSLWNLFAEGGLPISEPSTIGKHKCSNCSLMDIFDARLIVSQAHGENFENISSNFIHCVNNMTSKIWRFLVCGCHYLEIISNPIDFRWLGHEWHVHALAKCDDENSMITEDSIIQHHAEWYTNERRIIIYEVATHCLLYGGLLAHICYGQNSPLTTRVLNILYHVENIAD